ncbi:hypothetical protein ACIGC1_28500 [Peribacillus butanolivorans]|uniref:hypothetical protein n=1 Tax=Peribacillus butanolivorans TaxID=421767 RepID=UPI0037C9F81D
MILLKKVASVVMASTLFLGLSVSSTVASTNTQSVSESASIYQDNDIESTFEKMNDIASNTKEIKDSQRIQDIKNMSKDAVSNEKVVFNYSNASLDFDNAKFLDISQNNMNYTSITIPIVGDQYNFISNLTLIFDSQNKVMNYSESLITKSEDNKFVITSYIDGELVQSKVTDLDYKSNSELKKGLENIKQARGAKKIATCIAAVAGVDIAVAYLIAGTCTVSCPAVPPICAACIAAVATMGAGSIAGVIACFNLK